MQHKKWTVTTLAAALVLLAGGTVYGLINPKFTPKHLIEDCDIVAEVEAKAVKNDKCEVVIKRLLKGRLAARSIVIDLSASSFKEHAKTLEKIINESTSESALLFVGNFREGGDAANPGPAAPAAAGNEQKGFLNIGGNWAAITSTDGTAWNFDQNSSKMLETWRGGTDMLLRCCQYVIEDPVNSDVPSDERAAWAEAKQFVKITGVVHSAGPVTLSAGGKLSLFVTADSGDHLFDYDQKARDLKDITSAKKLTSKSKFYAWADFNGDGTFDLLSWDGESLVLFPQSTAGTFAAGQVVLSKAELGGDCLSLSSVDSGTKRPGVIIGTAQGPKIFVPVEKGSLKSLEGALPASDLGTPGRCLVADLDGDAVPDVLQFFSKGSLLFRGKSAGQWSAPERLNMAVGAGVGYGVLGDFDADGLLDLLTFSDDDVGIWQNVGKGKFVQAKHLTGEAAYNSPPGSCGGSVGDINNDGRQEFALFYSNSAPRSFFNRGFRCFGLANELDFTKKGLLPETNEGQQAGCWMDVNGDGAQDMVCVAKDGQLGVAFQGTDGTAKCIRVALSPKASFAGPLTVTGWRNGRCLGAWNVVTGTAEAFVAQDTADNIVLKWQFPGGKPQEKTISLENEPITFVIE